MKKTYTYAGVTLVVFGALTLLAHFTDAKSAIRTSHAIEEQWINANRVKVRINKQWQDFQLMPLADHVCQSGHPLFEKYCE
jgi:hypothetical protein